VLGKGSVGNPAGSPVGRSVGRLVGGTKVPLGGTKVPVGIGCDAVNVTASALTPLLGAVREECDWEGRSGPAEPDG
jgi:hypothetical protein